MLNFLTLYIRLSQNHRIRKLAACILKFDENHDFINNQGNDDKYTE